MSDITCLRCKFSEFPERGLMWECGLGYCHRHAPAPVLRKYIEDCDDLQEIIETFWPIVSQCDFCGEFVKNEAV